MVKEGDGRGKQGSEELRGEFKGEDLDGLVKLPSLVLTWNPYEDRLLCLSGRVLGFFFPICL